jgi:2-keto-3-deoxy-L-rhamnonate aldolase RhmA
MRRNTLMRILSRGDVARGLSIMIPSPQIVEMAGLLGFDWVLLDCEHGTMSPENVEIMVMASEAVGITAVGRPRSSAPEAILEVLERGVGGVQVPHVSTADQAEAVVASVRYHPLGRRGLAARTRPAAYGIGVSLEDHARSANEETLICLQLECREALSNIDEILDVPGVDVLFLGPSDLSQSFGQPGRSDHPEVRAAMDEAFGRIRARGRTSGSAGGLGAWHRYQELGVSYLYTHLPTVLAEGSRPFVAREDPERAANTH